MYLWTCSRKRWVSVVSAESGVKNKAHIVEMFLAAEAVVKREK
jgi:hypothetical protein